MKILIEKAVIEQALKALIDSDDGGGLRYTEVQAVAALREALAEPDIEEMTLTQIAARHEQAEQEPVCIDWDTKTDEPIIGYAAPVRTKDLTDDEIAAVTGYRKSGATWPVVEEVARAVIAADREKNK